MASRSTECALCGLPVLGRPLVDSGHEFCCEGCRRVWTTAEAAGLSELLDPERRGRNGGPREGAARKAAAALAAGARRETLRIEGMWCSSCGLVLEDALLAIDGVLDAEVGYASSLARVTYDPQAATREQVVDRIRLLGYDAVSAREAYAPRRDTEDLFLRFFVAASIDMWIMWPTLFMLYPAFWTGDFGEVSRVSAFTAVMSLVVLLYPGWPFLRGAWGAARVRRVTMDTLVVLGTWSAWLYSAWALATGSGPTYFESAAMITAIVLLGRWIEALSQLGSEATMATIASARPTLAWRLPGPLAVDAAEQVPAEDLVPGDTIAIRAGERVPADGEVLSGASTLDRSRLTGEPMPAQAATGDEVWAGTLNLESLLVVKVTRVDADTLAGRLAAVVEDAAFAKSNAQRLADTVARVFVPVVLAVAAASLLTALATGAGIAEGVSRAVAVLVVSCPCALGLATPLAVSNAVASAARDGVLVRGGTVLERAGAIATVAFDKTGTLTEGRPVYADMLGADGDAADAGLAASLLRATAALEYGETHPVAEAIRAAADASAQPGGTIWPNPAAESVQRVPAAGVSGVVDGVRVAVGSERLFGELGIDVPNGLAHAATQARARGDLVVLAAAGEQVAGLRFGDPLRTGAAEAVQSLAQRSINSAMVSGDAAPTCEAIAAATGITQVHAEVLPHEKEEVVRRLAEAGAVAFVGDGVNDAAALAASDLAIAIGGGSDLAIAAADVVLLEQSAEGHPLSPLAALPALVDLSGRSRRVIGQNLAWAFSYNALTLPLAATGRLSPIWAAVAMAGSSLAVVANSLRLRRRMRRP